MVHDGKNPKQLRKQELESISLFLLAIQHTEQHRAPKHNSKDGQDKRSDSHARSPAMSSATIGVVMCY